MKRSIPPSRPPVALAIGLLLMNSGCSFLFVNKPPPESGRVVEPRPLSCTSSKAAPILDTVFSGLEVARVALAANADDSAYQGQPISRGADIGLGVAFGVLFVSSAVYGYIETSHCSKLKQRAEQNDPVDLEPSVNPSPRPSASPIPPHP